MEPEEVTVTIPVPEPQDVVVTPIPAPQVVVVEDNQENSSDVVISEVIDLAVADAEKDARIAELEAQVEELTFATTLAAEAAQTALQVSVESATAVEEANDPMTTSDDDEEPKREHGFWRKMGSN
jgi:hypothetical protein